MDSPSPVPTPVGFVVKNGWKSLSLMSCGNADAIVAHPHLDGLRRDRAWSLSRAGLNVPSFTDRWRSLRRVKSVAEQVEKHARDVLRHEFDWRQCPERTADPE